MSTSSRPIMILIDLLGKKWMLRVLWELQQSPCTFRQLQARCGDISPTTINSRIKELHKTGLVDKSTEYGYSLSEQGDELVTLFLPINQFSERWAEELANR